MNAVTSRTVHPGRTRISWLLRAARRALLSKLGLLQRGTLHVTDGVDTRTFRGTVDEHSYQAGIQVHHPAFYRDVVLGGSIGAAESFMSGH